MAAVEREWGQSVQSPTADFVYPPDFDTETL